MIRLHWWVIPRVATLSAWLVLAAVAAPPSASSDQPPLVASFDPQGVTVREDGAPVLSYQSETRSRDGRWPRANYVHPLYDLRGEIITEDFPEDHGHHRGIFWAWHQVWVGDQSIGDAWACSDFDWDVQSVGASTPADPLTLTVVTHWKSPRLVDASGQPIPIVEETTSIVVHARRADHRVIDFGLSLRAFVPDVRIGGSDDEKGYGGFSPRIRLKGNEQFASASGTLQPAITPLIAGTWINITTPDSGFAMLVHRDNPQVTSEQATWILRRSHSMQNAVFPGRQPVAISMDEPIHLRYRIVIHDGSISDQAIAKLQHEFWVSAG